MMPDCGVDTRVSSRKGRSRTYFGQKMVVFWSGGSSLYRWVVVRVVQ